MKWRSRTLSGGKWIFGSKMLPGFIECLAIPDLVQIARKLYVDVNL